MKSNFLREIIDADLASGKHSEVVTRFPPEPNGYLHIGHARALWVNFGLAEHYGGKCHLRMDDTNPETEETEFVEAIQEDIRWLGYEWSERVYFASECFDFLWDCALRLVKQGQAYVDDQTVEQIRETRGELGVAGTPSPYRDRSVEENLDLLNRMRAGEFPDGTKVLRAKIDMAASNMIMRDPLMYRIRHVSHHRTGDDWCIYPMYDFAHGLTDSNEGITHSLCTLEFENNREIYDWLVEETKVACKPRQYEFAKLRFTYILLSKRKLKLLVAEGIVDGWDDPRMPTLAGMRRRGYTPEALKGLCAEVGVTKSNATLDLSRLEGAVRDDLNHKAPRVMGVLRPLEVVITNYEGEGETLEASYWPHDVPKEGSRPVPFGQRIFIEREDFAEAPPKGWHRLAPGVEVRLRYAYFIRCEEVVKDAEGQVVQLRCTYDPATRGGKSPDGRKVKGTLHWVAADEAFRAPVRLYDRLFNVEIPALYPDVHEALNPKSNETVEAALEPSLRAAKAGDRFQFERQGYFIVDTKDSADGPVFNRTVTLRDGWKKKKAPAKVEAPAPPRNKKADTRPQKRTRAQIRAAAREADAVLAAAYATAQQSLSAEDADVLTGDRAVWALYEQAVATYDAPAAVARWTINEVLRVAKDGSVAELPLTGEALGKLVQLVEDGTVSATAGKEVFAELVEKGGDPAAIVEAKGLTQVSDEASLRPIIAGVLEAHPDHVARYKGGNQGLVGFFVGQVMRGTGGKADPKKVNALLREMLA